MMTGYAYDPIEQEHTLAGHPEHKGRLSSAMQLLQADGILNHLCSVPVTPISFAHLQLIHPAAYIEGVRRMAEMGGGYLDHDTYVAAGSFAAALASAGGAVNLVATVMQGETANGMSLMRPPGHHALPNRGMGFCLFANIALAARVAQQEWGASRVLIVDWDVHHGNGTELIFYDDPSVAFFSTHQYPYYPGTGGAYDIGRGPGRGWTLNVPLPAHVGDAGYANAFSNILAPFARRFRPDLILVSAGYDAHWRDPLAAEQLTLTGYAHLARFVRSLADELCGGRLVIVLEGGYDLDVLAHGILTTLRILADPNAPVSDPFGPSPFPERSIQSLLAEIHALHHLAE